MEQVHIGQNFKDIIEKIIRKSTKYYDKTDLCDQLNIHTSTLNSTFSAKSINSTIIFISQQLNIDLNLVAGNNIKNCIQEIISPEEKLLLNTFSLNKKIDSLIKRANVLKDNQHEIYDAILKKKISFFGINEDKSIIINPIHDLDKTSEKKETFLNIGFCGDIHKQSGNCTPTSCFSCKHYITTKDYIPILEYYKDLLSTDKDIIHFESRDHERYNNSISSINQFIHNMRDPIKA